MQPVYDMPLLANQKSDSTDAREYAEALTWYQEAIEHDPENADAYVELAWLLATHPDKRYRNGQRAISLVRKALAIGSAHPALLEALAAAHAEAGDFDRQAHLRRRPSRSQCAGVLGLSWQRGQGPERDSKIGRPTL